MKKKNNITVYGAGYVGLVTAVCFAELGYHVMVIDIDADKISSLSQGILPFYEPDLDVLLAQHIVDQLTSKNLPQKNLHFSTDEKAGVAHGFYQMIAVGTPAALDGSADLQHVFAVAE